MINEEEKYPFEKDQVVPEQKTEVERPKKTEEEKITTQEKAQEYQPAKAVVTTTKEGLLVGETIESQFRIAKAHLLSRLLPNHFDTVEKVLTGTQFAYELGLKPLTGLRQIAIINGTPSIWGELPLGLCLRSGLLEFINEEVFAEDGTKITPESNKTAYKAVCTVKRKGFPEPTIRFFSLADAQQAGLLNKTGSPWQKYQRRMLQMRSRAWAIKDTFADVLAGISIAEYDHDVLIDNSGGMIGGPQRQTSIASELNKTFLQAGQETQEGTEPEAVHNLPSDPK